MHHRDDNTPGHEAHEVSQTRFGPRPPVGEAPIPASRRIPPSGKVSPKGDREWPTPSLTSQVVVYGGAALMAAAATAGVVLAARKIAGMIGGDGDDHRPQPVERAHVAPRYADMEEYEREAVRRRVREQARADATMAARTRSQASRDRHGPRPNAAQSLTRTANDLSGSITGMIGALTGAVSGFRSVAQQAGGIVREFSDAADVVRGILDSGRRDEGRRHDRDYDDKGAPHSPRTVAGPEAQRAERRTHNL